MSIAQLRLPRDAVVHQLTEPLRRSWAELVSTLVASEKIEPQVRQWLEQAGLGSVCPFLPLDAGADPNLSHYLVRYDVFSDIWSDRPSIVLAPAGGGKSAFRVRLAHACRVEEDRRHVFAIPYLGPEPDATTLAIHLECILRQAGRELLLALFYRPMRFHSLDAAGRASVRAVLDQNVPGLLDHVLPQLREHADLSPLIKNYDASISGLSDMPEPEQIVAMCDALDQLPAIQARAPAEERFEQLKHLVLNEMGYEAIYLLIDGVDAFLAPARNPAQALAIVTPLLRQMPAWASEKIFLKWFLPIELKRALPKELTKSAGIATIEWNKETLINVLHARLRAASRGQFDSFDAISSPSVRNVEAELLKTAPPVPRELLILANSVIVEHVRRAGASGGLDREDVRAAIKDYRRKPRPFSP